MMGSGSILVVQRGLGVGLNNRSVFSPVDFRMQILPPGS